MAVRPKPRRAQLAAVLVNPGDPGVEGRVRFASYGPGVVTPGAALYDVEVVTEAQIATVDPRRLRVTLARFTPGTAIPGGYRVVSESAGQTAIEDSFSRADSALSLGTPDKGPDWLAPGAGTFGISSGQAYAVTDANLNAVMIESGVADASFRWSVVGDFTSSLVYRAPDVCFRGSDHLNTLVIQLYNGTVVLYKRVTGTFTLLATVAQTTVSGVGYELRADCLGNLVSVYVNGALKISYTLAGGDTVFSTRTKAGLLLVKGGAPTQICRWDDMEVIL